MSGALATAAAVTRTNSFVETPVRTSTTAAPLPPRSEGRVVPASEAEAAITPRHHIGAPRASFGSDSLSMLGQNGEYQKGQYRQQSGTGVSHGGGQSLSPPRIPRHVTPPDNAGKDLKMETDATCVPTSSSPLTTTAGEGGKHVRFGKYSEHDDGENDGQSEHAGDLRAPPVMFGGRRVSGSAGMDGSSYADRGLPPKRGRYTSPSLGRRPEHQQQDLASPVSKNETILEFRTFRSPSRKRDEDVPPLCTTNSDVATSASSVAEKTVVTHENASNGYDGEGRSEVGVAAMSVTLTAAARVYKQETAVTPATSISCDPSKLDHASPLVSRDNDDEAGEPERTQAADRGGGSSKISLENDRGDASQHRSALKQERPGPPCRTLSPPPSSVRRDDEKHTPMRTPLGGGHGFQVLPSLDDARFTSPGGFFLSPNPPTPSYGGGLLDEEKKRDCDLGGDGNDEDHATDVKRSPLVRRDRERDHYMATPTDFSLDYGKGQLVSGSFDTSNVLAWLQSPTANGLFSPGGFGSILNSPRAGVSSSASAAAVPRTPKTPTISTSFFFSDVAGLPQGETAATPKGEGTSTAQAGQAASADSSKKSNQKGISNIICISPLASSRFRSEASNSNTPMNYKDIFASPQERAKARRLPLLNDSPSKDDKPRVPHRSGSKDPSLDAVHMAERDLMEDEDLSVLLQLASNTPSRSSDRGPAGGAVFRSPNGRKDEKRSGDGNLPGLQLPIIGNTVDGESKGLARLAQKTRSRDHADEFVPPQLGMRSFSSSGSKDMYVGSSLTKIDSKKKDSGSSEKIKPDKKESGSKAKGKGKKGSSSSSKSYSRTPYPARTGSDGAYPQHTGSDASPYYSVPGKLPHGVPPSATGSMRVVVGGPPPPRGGAKPGAASPPRGSPHPPPHFHDYPHPPYPPHGMYSQYPGPPFGGYSYQSHYPPPPPPPPARHMPMYGAQQQPPHAPPKSTTKKTKTPTAKQSSKPDTKAGTKRSSPQPDSKTTGSSKKAKKTSPTNSSKKKKSPQHSGGDKAAEYASSLSPAGGGKNNEKAAALAAAIMRGVTMRPSGKWQAQLYFAGKSRYIGVFDTREKAALAYEIAREKLKSGPHEAGGNAKSTETLVNLARKAAFEGVKARASG